MNEMKVAVFELNGDILGTDALLIKEIVKYGNIKSIEDVPPYFEGFFDYRGEMVPVINLNEKFKFGETNVTKKTKIIITFAKDEYIGYVVNDVTSILNIGDNDIEDIPNIVFKPGKNYLKKVIKKDQAMIAVLDITKVLSEDEIGFIGKVREDYIKSKIN